MGQILVLLCMYTTINGVIILITRCILFVIWAPFVNIDQLLIQAWINNYIHQKHGMKLLLYPHVSTV